MNHWEQTKLLNQLPLNRAAKALLPVDWRGEDSLHCLGLILWMVREAGLDPKFRPGPDSVESMVVKLMRDPPQDAMEYLTTNDSGDVVLTEADLEGLDQEEGGVVLVQALADKMIATAP